MDPVTLAIVSALASGAVSGVAEKMVKEAYNVLRHKLKSTFGKDSELVKSVERLEARPDSNARRALVQEEVTIAKAEQYEEVLRAAQVLLGTIKDQPEGEKVIQQAIGNNIAQASGGSTASVNVNRRKD
jgi:glycyl-tRNA synthetase beta subunit